MSIAFNDQPNGTVRIYAVGGGGINMVKPFINSPKGTEHTADIEVTMFDTSMSNLDPSLDPRLVHLLPGVDGSGKDPRENLEAIAEFAPELLKKAPPAELNLVVSTASGGTGNAMLVQLVRRLLEGGHNVIPLVVGSEESGIAASNTYKTLKSLSNQQQSSGRSLTMGYYHMDTQAQRSEADEQVRLWISTLSLLVSRRNKEFDTKDFANFLGFEKFYPNLGPCMALLNVYWDNGTVENMLTPPLAMASLYHSVDDKRVDIKITAQWEGFYVNPTDSLYPFHVTIGLGGLPELLKRMEKLDEEYQRTRSIQIPTVTFGNTADADPFGTAF